MEFKKLEIKQEKNPVKRIWSNRRFRKSIFYTLAGAILGFLFFFFTEGMYMDKMSDNDIFQSMIIGALMGFFITNSPCARGRC